MPRVWTICASLLLCGGCSAYATYQNARAARGVAQAHEADAAARATYEATLAEEYLAKAREEASQAHYADSVHYAKRSQEMSGRAVAQARSGAREVSP